MRRNKVFDFWFRKQYIIAGALVLFAAFGMTALYSHNQEKERERLEQELSEISEQGNEVAEEQEEVEHASSIVPPKNTEAANRKVEELLPSVEEKAVLEPTDEIAGEIIEEPEVLAEAPAKSVSSNTPSLHFPKEEGMTWPLEGNVIMNYSMDATIYYATLDQYKYNPAIIISGDVNSKVYAVAQGKITDISQNEVTGTTVTVDLGDGYQAIYGQLKELNFKEGDYLEPGHVIGYVSEPTKYFSVEGSNLYFELQKDGEPVDPIAYFE